MDHRRYQAEFMSGLARRDEDHDIADHIMFPPANHSLITQLLLGISPRTASLCDISTPAGLALAMQNHDPLVTAYLSRLDGRYRDE